MRWRLRSVRTRIFVLVLVPVLSLIGLYVFATGITARDAIAQARSVAVKNATSGPTGTFLAQLDPERLLAMTYLSAPTGANLARLELQESKTNAAAAALHAALSSPTATRDASLAERRAIAALVRDLSGVPSLHAQVAAQIITRQRAFGTYNRIVDDADLVLNDAIRQQASAALVSQALAVVRMGKSRDLLLQENALLTADLAAHSLPAADLQQFTELAGARRALYEQTLPDIDPAYRAYYRHDVSPMALATVASLEDTVISGTRPGALPPLRPGAWKRAVAAVAGGFSRAGAQSADALALRAHGAAQTIYLRLILVGGTGLFAVVVSVIMSVVIGRRQVQELGSLRQSALELANSRLPDVVAKLAAGQHVDARADVAGVPARTYEIDQVREAFATVQETAVAAAVGQARLRQGINEIFRNLARRSQSLLHRQLTLLDAMERRAGNPQELEDLFRVDHLATRMRRHAESLIILSGDSPARGWRHPVLLVDVLRAAVAEVEDYTRIKVTAATEASLVGPAVGDVIHMIAELVENATIYSPPQTPVSVSGGIVGQGFAVEIEDRGLGMSGEQRAQINQRLENPPPFDLTSSDQLGLFVAGQLAKRHGIRISLRSSPYGGTTAIVLIPHNLVVPEGTAPGDRAAIGARSTAAIGARSTVARGSRRAIVGGDEQPRPGGQYDSHPAPVVPSAVMPGAAWPGPETGPADWAQPETGPADSDAQEAGWAGAASTGESGTAPHPGEAWVPTEPAAGDGEHRGADAGDRPGDGSGPRAASTGAADSVNPAALDAVLPRRVRQANLAPQLRDGPARPAAPIPDLGDLADRSPEETRATMSAIQRGWERGRSLLDATRTGREAGTGDGDHAAGITPTGTTPNESQTAEGPEAGDATAQDSTAGDATAQDSTAESITANATVSRGDAGSAGTHRAHD